MATQACHRCGERFERRDAECPWCGFPAAPPTWTVGRLLAILGLAVVVLCASVAAVVGVTLYISDHAPIAPVGIAPAPTAQPLLPAGAEAPAAPTSPEPPKPAAESKPSDNGPPNAGAETIQVPDAWTTRSLVDPDGSGAARLDAPWEGTASLLPSAGQ